MMNSKLRSAGIQSRNVSRKGRKRWLICDDSRERISGQRRLYPQIAWILQIHIGIPPSPFPISICVIGEIGGLLLSRAKVRRIGTDAWRGELHEPADVLLGDLGALAR